MKLTYSKMDCLLDSLNFAKDDTIYNLINTDFYIDLATIPTRALLDLCYLQSKYFKHLWSFLSQKPALDIEVAAKLPKILNIYLLSYQKDNLATFQRNFLNDFLSDVITTLEKHIFMLTQLDSLEVLYDISISLEFHYFGNDSDILPRLVGLSRLDHSYSNWILESNLSNCFIFQFSQLLSKCLEISAHNGATTEIEQHYGKYMRVFYEILNQCSPEVKQHLFSEFEIHVFNRLLDSNLNASILVLVSITVREITRYEQHFILLKRFLENRLFNCYFFTYIDSKLDSELWLLLLIDVTRCSRCFIQLLFGNCGADTEETESEIDPVIMKDLQVKTMKICAYSIEPGARELAYICRKESCGPENFAFNASSNGSRFLLVSWFNFFRNKASLNAMLIELTTEVLLGINLYQCETFRLIIDYLYEAIESYEKRIKAWKFHAEKPSTNWKHELSFEGEYLIASEDLIFRLKNPIFAAINEQNAQEQITLQQGDLIQKMKQMKYFLARVYANYKWRSMLLVKDKVDS